MHISKTNSNAKGSSSSITSSFKQVIKEEGFAGLYKGISSKLVQSVLTSSLMFGFKEELFRLAMALLVALNLRSRNFTIDKK